MKVIWFVLTGSSLRRVGENKGRMEILLRNQAFKPKVGDDGLALKCGQNLFCKWTTYSQCVWQCGKVLLRISFKTDLQGALAQALEKITGTTEA